MDEQQALNKMIAPGTRRRGKWRDGVIQIWTTRACDKSCFGCTQGSNLKGPFARITPEQFETAVMSLETYFGVVGVFGGNPAVHPQFDELCAILRKHIPQERCGLWSNKPFGHGATMRKTFNPRVSNLNVHLDREAYNEFKRDWPESLPFGLDKDSRHSPVYVAMKDVIHDEADRWNLISECDINRHWSAMVGVFRGELRGYFCEIAGSQAMLHQNEANYPDTGIPIYRGEGRQWWQRSMQDFAEQVRTHCHSCGVPLRGYGSLAQANDSEGIEQVSATHAEVYQPKRSARQVEFVSDIAQLQAQSLGKFTDYLGNASR